jgi:hypothetical protein
VQGESGRIRVPRASRDSILIFGGGGGGDLPDVVAPYLFLRAVRCQHEAESVDLESELRKCSLLIGVEDDRFLRAAVALWGGALDDVSSATSGTNQNTSYVLVDPLGGVVAGDKTWRALPDASGAGNEPAIRFVLTTRGDTIRVSLPSGHVLAVTRDMLDSDRALDVEREKRRDERKMAERHRDAFPDAGAASAPAAIVAWAQFVYERVLPRVRIQFLFVRSDVSPLDATSSRRDCSAY